MQTQKPLAAFGWRFFFVGIANEKLKANANLKLIANENFVANEKVKCKLQTANSKLDSIVTW